MEEYDKDPNYADSRPRQGYDSRYECGEGPGCLAILVACLLLGSCYYSCNNRSKNTTPNTSSLEIKVNQSNLILKN